jgi:hypothetical protein
MHYFGAVVMEKGGDIEAAIDTIMAPHEERWEGEDDEGEHFGIWDWYQVGGRWTGEWSEYDPTQDPANTQVCTLCNGTGVRPDGLERFGEEWMQNTGGCNGCKGTGKEAKWPTEWSACPDDRRPVSMLLNNPTVKVPYTVFFPDGTLLTRESPGYDEAPDEHIQAVHTALAPWSDHDIVIVDYHC